MTKLFSSEEQPPGCCLDYQQVEFILASLGCSLKAKKVTTQYRMKIRHLKDQIILMIASIQEL